MSLLNLLGPNGLIQLPMCRVLYFHSFGKDELDMPLERFEEIVVGLLNKGFHLTSSEKATWSKKNVVITFDDGYANNLGAIEILAKHNCSGTVFMCSDYIGSSAITRDTNLYPNRRFLSRYDLKRIVELGSEIGSHGAGHINYGTSSPRTRRQDLRNSVKTLEGVLDKRIMAFAFPNGQRGAFQVEDFEMFADCGIKMIFTTVWGRMNKKQAFKCRCEVRHTDDVKTVLAKVKGKYVHRFIFDRYTKRGMLWT